ncbi:TetR/AcrR family transcriptional regulator [Aeromicrobium sp. 9AM]|uniref:TetR/AcrR family transcriptional regulator n=1 Tax=Aeromicrobium sp. 9AM TaxID=2653126 RepID=UPI0012F3BD92|nr:TetR/AcrR family transcriptional regulator [Aeromicrobium sp. 9AM]VXB27829.1 Transcriptional regulator [Aeromicrobium sp. 9AM]
MSTPYEASGRVEQKSRTRTALVTAAREMVSRGLAPSVPETADAAGISRTTAYRYFPNQRTLLAAAHPETGAESMLGDNPSTDPAKRLDEVIARFTAVILETEAQQRTMLRLSLEDDPEARGGQPLRQGRAIGWITEALDPLRDQLSDDELHRLVLAIRSATGIEALVWLTDIGGLSREAAVELMRWSAQSMLQAALGATSRTG